MPQITRRTCLSLTAAAALAPCAAFSAQRITLGEAELITLSDGNLMLPPEFIFGVAPQDDLAELAPQLGIDPTAPLTPPCNITLFKTGDRTILIDCGAGAGFQPSVGRLIDTLANEGLSPEDITDVIFTHGHPDHLWGVLDDFDEPLFVNARHQMSTVERDFWLDPETVERIGEARASFAVGASRRIAGIEGMLETFEPGAEVAPGITAIATPGHTPGHTSFAISSGGTTVLVIGDAVTNDHVALARPNWPSGADGDLERAAETRLRLLDQIATDQMIVVGFHMRDGGLGRVEAAGDGYRFVPEV